MLTLRCLCRPAIALAAALCGLALNQPLNPVASAAPGHGPPRLNPPKHYLLALGDSITYGFQNAKYAAGLPATAFNTGYVDGLAARLREIRSDLAVVNYGCPGESTSTFIAGPCLYNTLGLPLHDAYGGSQLNAALALLNRRPGQVSPITLKLLGNDINEFVAACGGDFDCIRGEAPAAIARFGSRLATILERLRRAAPNAEIIVLGGWNTSVAADPDVDPLFDSLNAVIVSVAAHERALFADLAPLFNPQAATARATAICTLTLLCSDGDGHPSDAGYRAIADAVFASSGYGHLATGEE